ncbi:hypothetical protein [Natrinema pallidum]|uniref:Uncharacterized protein n=1 Tax=Natrinema pallidum DSM 3751 TaxID=1227495 RepID=L9YGK9_9EURY|nr:hypothetical protein [Natrinema pallidum]ELY73260.1 hypothetical protein C487_17700 [Natrinema pallidum DSM 3751]
MTDPRTPADRLEGFAAEANSLENVDATNYESEVAVSVVGDESDLVADLEPIFETAVRYGVVPFDGSAGSNVADLHFKPADVVFGDGDSE